MKGRTPTRAERELWDRIAALGCIACRKDGVVNRHVSIHHVHGRARPGSHRQVLPLCFEHHQSGSKTAPSVHPWKARFEAKYGRQDDLVAEIMDQLEER